MPDFFILVTVDSYSLKQFKEEVNSSITHRNTFGIADDAVVTVPHRTVAVDIAQYRVVAVSDGAAVNLCNQSVVRIPDVSIAADSCHQAVVTVPYITIRINGSQHRVVAVPDGLSPYSRYARHHRHHDDQSFHTDS